MKHPTTTSHVCRTHYVAVIPVVTLRSSTIICPKTPQSAFFAVLSLHWRRASMHSKIAAQVLCIDGTFLTGRYKGTMLIAIAADGYAAGTTPEDSYGAAQAPPSPQGVAEQMAQSLFASPTQEELGYSQLHDAPPRATQQSEDQEAVHDSPPPRRTRQPRDPFSHGSRHTWAAQRAARRSKRGRS
ncbi:hypothetical protein U9M48_041522 [Paspalum notatum var. saurae]|uniref:Uncharacterized protein n=1 Tax=Paspalum notatum var. saurae TaxID=547442 RepID=A0AAQ3UP87_PASNO